MSAGSRPASSAAASIVRFIAGSSSGGAYGLLGNHPSASRPVSPSIRSLYAPTQIPTSCAGAGPGCAPQTR